MELHGHGFQFASCEMTGGHQAMHEIPMAGHFECPEPLLEDSCNELHIPALNRLVLWHFSASSANNMLYKDV